MTAAARGRPGSFRFDSKIQYVYSPHLWTRRQAITHQDNTNNKTAAAPASRLHLVCEGPKGFRSLSPHCLQILRITQQTRPKDDVSILGLP